MIVNMSASYFWIVVSRAVRLSKSTLRPSSQYYRELYTAPQAVLIRHLNPVIRGWSTFINSSKQGSLPITR